MKDCGLKFEDDQEGDSGIGPISLRDDDDSTGSGLARSTPFLLLSGAPCGSSAQSYQISRELLYAAVTLLDAASTAKSKGDLEAAGSLVAAADEMLKIVQMLADVTIAFTPAGPVKDLAEALTGHSLLPPDFRELTREEQVFAWISVGIGPYVKGMTVLHAIAEETTAGNKLVTALEKTLTKPGKVFEDIGKRFPKIAKYSQEIAEKIDPKKLARSGDDFIDIVARNIEEVDIAVQKNTAAFYSGGANEEIVHQLNYIKATQGGKWLNEIDKLLKSLVEELPEFAQKYRTKLWPRLSERFARAAEGDVVCAVVGSSSTSVFRTVELPVLRESLQSGKVTKIKFLNPDTTVFGEVGNVVKLDEILARLFHD